MRIEHQLDILSPSSVVYGLTVDVERWPSMFSTVESVELVDGSPLRVGSRARLKQPGQRPTTWTVTELEQNRLFVWQAKAMGMHMVASHVSDPTQTDAPMCCESKWAVPPPNCLAPCSAGAS